MKYKIQGFQLLYVVTRGHWRMEGKHFHQLHQHYRHPVER